MSHDTNYFARISPKDGSILPYKITKSTGHADNWTPNIPARVKDNRPIARVSKPSHYAVKRATSTAYHPVRPGAHLPNIESPAMKDANAAMLRLERMLGI